MTLAKGINAVTSVFRETLDESLVPRGRGRGDLHMKGEGMHLRPFHMQQGLVHAAKCKLQTVPNFDLNFLTESLSKDFQLSCVSSESR